MPAAITWALHALSISKCSWDLSSKPTYDRAEVKMATEYNRFESERGEGTTDWLAKFKCTILVDGHETGFVNIEILAEFDIQGDYEALSSNQDLYHDFTRDTSAVVNGHIRSQLIKICADAGLEGVILLPLSGT
jgi:hypothetical protein